MAANTEATDGRQGAQGDFRRSRVARALARADQAVVIADAITPFCGIGCVMFALVAVAQFSSDKTPGAWASSTLAAVTSVVLGLAFLLLRSGRGEFMREHSLIFGTIVGALVGLNPLVYILGTQITYPAIGMLLVIVGVGGMVHDWFAAIVVILLLDLVWILCAVAFGLPAGIAPATFVSQILKANALAIVLNIARTRTVHRFEQARLEVHRMANTDELTGLANQRGLLEVARSVPDREDKVGRPRDLAVVYVDVDGLKSINDAHGHAAGDALIRATGNVLRGAFRPDDTIARVGGDEFAILLDDVHPGLIQELVGRTHEHLAVAGISASIGTASATSGAAGFDLPDLLARADAAMYAVKVARKNGHS
ncbi:MAG: GGDEF domain-containing protein [Nakamurella sp.]